MLFVLTFLLKLEKILLLHYSKALKALCAKVQGNPIVYVILFTSVTKLQKLVRWFNSINEEKQRIASDATSHRRNAIGCTVVKKF